MLLPRFEFHEPKSLKEACQIKRDLGPAAGLLAGGTDLLVNMKKKVVRPSHVVSLGQISELKDIDFKNGEIRLGACMTAGEIAESEDVKGILSALAQGALSLGTPLVRNLATVGGNLVTARPAADLPPALMAYGAKVVLRNLSGERSVLLEGFFKGPGQTVIGPDEILTHVMVERPPKYSGAAYLKLGIRETLEISIVNVATYIALNAKDGTIETARVVLGAVAPRPIRALSAETVLRGQRPSEALFKKAAEAACGDSQPIDDFRASAEYRRAMVGVLTQRTLAAAYRQAGEGK